MGHAELPSGQPVQMRFLTSAAGAVWILATSRQAQLDATGLLTQRYFQSSSNDANALSPISSIVLTSISPSSHSTTRLSCPAQVTAPNSRLKLARGKAPPGFIIRRSSSNSPCSRGKSNRVRLVIVVPTVVLSREFIFSLLRIADVRRGQVPSEHRVAEAGGARVPQHRPGDRPNRPRQKGQQEDRGRLNAAPPAQYAVLSRVRNPACVEDRASARCPDSAFLLYCFSTIGR